MENRGFILGTVDKSNANLSVRANPHVHPTQHEAVAEAKRLLLAGSIEKDRKVVVLAIAKYIAINQDPFVVE